MPRCILFDCDGTLVDSEPVNAAALSDTFAGMGITLAPEVIMQRFAGGRLALTGQTVAREHGVVLPESFIEDFRERCDHMLKARLEPVAGVAQVLAQLTVPVAVVSSGPLYKIKMMLRICGLAGHFGENLYSSYDLGSWKPDPGIYLHAAERMGFAPPDCTAVEDSTTGVLAAINAGIPALHYNPHGAPHPHARAVSFSAMHELLDLLQV